MDGENVSPVPFLLRPYRLKESSIRHSLPSPRRFNRRYVHLRQSQTAAKLSLAPAPALAGFSQLFPHDGGKLLQSAWFDMLICIFSIIDIGDLLAKFTLDCAI